MTPSFGCHPQVVGHSEVFLDGQRANVRAKEASALAWVAAGAWLGAQAGRGAAAGGLCGVPSAGPSLPAGLPTRQPAPASTHARSHHAMHPAPPLCSDRPQTNLADHLCDTMVWYTHQQQAELLQAYPGAPLACLIGGGTIRCGGRGAGRQAGKRAHLASAAGSHLPDAPPVRPWA